MDLHFQSPHMRAPIPFAALSYGEWSSLEFLQKIFHVAMTRGLANARNLFDERPAEQEIVAEMLRAGWRQSHVGPGF
jgi:hypothetical protein